MNGLSWFLYLADVIGNFQGVLIFLSILFGAASVIWLIAKGVVISDDDENAKRFANFLWFVPWGFLVCCLTASLIPSKEAIYLIAGSEAGEAVVTSPEGKEILNDIQEVIRTQLDSLKPQKE